MPFFSFLSPTHLPTFFYTTNARGSRSLLLINRGRASPLGCVGIVRSPIFTTLMQVSSRILLVWGVVGNYPEATSTSLFYSSMLLAWSITEIIRYSYFMFNLIGTVPGFLTWLRYNTFYVLYPVGITSEMLLIFNVSNVVADNVWQQWAFRGILLVYVPGSLVPFFPTFIIGRRKILG